LRQRSGEQVATLIDGDDALLALAGRVRWLEALVALTSVDTPEPTSEVRGAFLWEWMHTTLALVHPTPADAMRLLMRMYHDLQAIREPWSLGDVMQNVFPHTTNTAMVAEAYPAARKMMDNRSTSKDERSVAINHYSSFFLLQFMSSNCSAGMFNRMVRNLLLVRCSV